MSLKKLFKIPYCKVNTVEDYFQLPKKEREYKGFYKVPCALPNSLFKNNKSEKTWDDFYAEIKRLYPIQYFLREYLPSLDNPILCAYYNIKSKIRLFFNPVFPRWRKSLPRHEYADLIEFVPKSNFALILDFYYEEVLNGIVDWEADEPHREFLIKLKEHVAWIETGKKLKENQLVEAISNQFTVVEFTEADKVRTIEEEIFNRDTDVLNWLIANRGIMWT